MTQSTCRLIARLLISLSLVFGLTGCIGTIVGAVVDVGIEVVKVPFKVGKAVYDVSTSDDDDEKKTEKSEAKK